MKRNYKNQKVKTTTIKMWIIAIYICLILQILTFMNVKKLNTKIENLKSLVTSQTEGGSHE